MHGGFIGAASSKFPKQDCKGTLASVSLCQQSSCGLTDAGMVGDVNLYLNDADDPTTGEIEVISWQNAYQQLVLSHIIQL